MNLDWPLVSVIIPAYNAQSTILRALDSVYAQDYPNLEVIVVDDKSNDLTASITADYDKLDVCVVTLEENSGAAAARNEGIKRSKGELIAFLDADDEWLEGKLKKQVVIFQEVPEICAVTCEANLISSDRSIIRRVNEGRPRSHGSGGWRCLLRCPCVATPCVVVRRSAVLAVGPFNTDLASGEDQDMWIRLAEYGLFHHLDEVLANVYDRSNSLSKQQQSRVFNYFLPVIESHIRRNSYRLRKKEIKTLLAQRYAEAGRTFLANKRYGSGVYYLTRSSIFGYSIFENLKYILRHVPLVSVGWNWAKIQFGRD